MDAKELIQEYRNELVLTSIIILLAGAMVSGSSQPADEKVTITASELIGFEPMSYAMSHHKVPEPEGLNIELQTASFTAAEVDTLASDSPSIGVLSNVRLAKAYNNDKNFKVLAPWYREGMCEHADMTVGQLVTAKNSSIKDPKDLEGSTVGLIGGRTGGSAIALQTALRVRDVNLSKIDFRGVKSESAPLMVREGKLDASMFDSDYIMKDDFDQNYRTALDFGKVLHDEFGRVPPSQFVVVREKYYEENPEKYDKAVQWLRDNYEWARDNKEKLSRARAEENDRDYDLLMKKFGCFSRIGDVTQEDLDVLEEYFRTAEAVGAIDKTPETGSVLEGAVERDY